jgi:hypothetical protein
VSCFVQYLVIRMKSCSQFFAINNRPSLCPCIYFGFVFDGVGGLEHSWAVSRLDGIFVLHGGKCGECAVCRVWIAVCEFV